jgi:hypothetical protein
MSEEIRKMAMDIVIREEQRNGWSPCAIGAARGEKEHGCDILSAPPSGGKPHPVEVKGWGERFRGPSGKFLYAQDVRASQMAAARQDDNFRVEIVANLAAHIADGEPYECLTLHADQVRSALPRLYEVVLDGMANEIRYGDGRRSDEIGGES